MIGLSLHYDDAMFWAKSAPQLVGRYQASDSTAEYDNSLAGHFRGLLALMPRHQ
jgi:hypothetical protein